MPDLRHPHWPLALRVFVLGLLMFGLVMKPVLAAACEIEDARQALVGEHAVPTVNSSDHYAGEDCCVVQNCGECCVHVAAMVPQVKVADTFAVAPNPLPALSVEFEPTAYPVAFRPPIAI
jgi:hypothetical protein